MKNICNNFEFSNNISKNEFSLSKINFEKIYKNLEKERYERKGNSSIDNIDNEQIILELRYKMREDLYNLIDKDDNEKLINYYNQINNNSNNIDTLGKKRKSDISLDDMSVNFNIKKNS